MSDAETIADLKRELELAVSECCNAYYWNGHADRVAQKYGIQINRDGPEEWKNYPRAAA